MGGDVQPPGEGGVLIGEVAEQDKEGSRTKDTDGNTITACALAFCQVVEDAGYTPMLYGSFWWAETSSPRVKGASS